MWKIFFKYSDKSELEITGREKDITLRRAVKYYDEYGRKAERAVYQQYPKKDHEPVDLCRKIEQLKEREVSE